MRIIAGEHRGRKLLAPESDLTRPITDRVKQSLFDILTPIIDDAVVYDCFAGTGSLGLEALSRGARQAIFFERDRSALARLRRNIQAMDLSKRTQVIAADIFTALRPESLPPAQIIFLDPPYRFLSEAGEQLKELTGQLATKLAPGGVVVFRHAATDDLELPPLQRYDRRVYGSMTLDFLNRADE